MTSQRIDLFVHFENPTTTALEGKVDQVLSVLNAVVKLEAVMANELDNLTATLVAEVERQTSVDESVEALLAGIGKQLADALAAAGATPAQLAALKAVMDKAKANNDKLAEAITANTPPA